MSIWLRLRLRLGRYLLSIIGVLLTFGVLFTLATPWLLEWISENESIGAAERRQWFDWVEASHHWLLVILLSSWVFAFGSSIASFLNVVAYRWPRGGSILGRSHCPRCHARLSMWDNMPIFGWLRNGGRCAHCRLPISARYLVVELILGAGFLLAFWAEFAPLADRNFSRALNEPGGWIAFHLIAFAATAAVQSAIFVAALLQWERTKTPTSLIATLWIVCAAFSMAEWWIQASVVRQVDERSLPAGSELVSNFFLVDIAALITAFVIGAILPLESDSHEGNRSGIDAREVFVFALLGLALSWRMIVLVSLTTAGILLLMQLMRIARRVPLGCVFVGILIALVAQWLFRQWLAPDREATLMFKDVGLTATAFILAIATRALLPSPKTQAVESES